MKVKKSLVEQLIASKMITKTDLSKTAQINPVTLRSALKGKECSPKVVGKIAKALNVEVSEIIEEE